MSEQWTTRDATLKLDTAADYLQDLALWVEHDTRDNWEAQRLLRYLAARICDPGFGLVSKLIRKAIVRSSFKS
jgi:hypothetical protein